MQDIIFSDSGLKHMEKYTRAVDKLKEDVLGYVRSGSGILQLPTAELMNMQKWMIASEKLERLFTCQTTLFKMLCK